MSDSMNEMDDIINDFIEESNESLETLDQKFVELEKNPGDTSLLNDIFRSIHTIKGAAGFLGFQQMVEITHVTEDALNKLRKGEMSLNPTIMDAILQSVDMIRVLLQHIKNKDGKKENIEPITRVLTEILEGKHAGEGTKKKKKSAKKPASSKKSAKKKAETEAGKPAEKKNAQPVEVPQVREKEQTLRVDTERLDNVMNLTGEMVLSRNRLVNLGAMLNELDAESELVGAFEEALSQLDLVTTDMQLAVMKMRMQPIAKVFNKFPRVVRDLCRQTGKEAELVIRGEETELDKTVIEEIGDPLVHLVRNAVDHGMEVPDEREKDGKPRCGTVVLSAYQEGRHIMVEVSDDGKGMDPEKIKESAIGKGLISEEEAGRLSRNEALSLIFTPGFSTAKNVSNISGRGVGMDVVKTNINKINGTISVDSEPGRGSRIIFRLPLTLAIIPALTVEAGEEVYGIPLSNVIENIRMTEEDLSLVNGREAIQIRDSVYPIIRLSSLVGVESASASSEWMYVVIIGVGEKRFGLLVDKLHGQEEIVMKSMGEYLKGTPGIAGACITGDGDVILILDVAGLLEIVDSAVAA